MNEVQSMTKAGEAVGTVLGTALMTARQGAVAASKTSASASRRLAKRTQHRLADRGIDRGHLQDVLTENVRRARHELATKIEPPRHRRLRLPLRSGGRRRPWLLALAAIGAAAAVAVLARRSRARWESEYVEQTERPASEPEPASEPTVEPATEPASASGNGSAPRELEPNQTARAKPSPAPRRSATSRSTTGGANAKPTD